MLTQPVQPRVPVSCPSPERARESALHASTARLRPFKGSARPRQLAPRTCVGHLLGVGATGPLGLGGGTGPADTASLPQVLPRPSPPAGRSPRLLSPETPRTSPLPGSGQVGNNYGAEGRVSGTSRGALRVLGVLTRLSPERAARAPREVARHRPVPPAVENVARKEPDSGSRTRGPGPSPSPQVLRRGRLADPPREETKAGRLARSALGISLRCLATGGRSRAPRLNPAGASNLLPWGKTAAAAALGPLGSCGS